MANFAEEFKPCLPFLELDSNIELINQYLSPNFLEYPSLSIQNDNFVSQLQPQPEFPVSFVNNMPTFFCMNDSKAAPVDRALPSAANAHQPESKKRKGVSLADTSSGNSSTPVIENGLGGKTKTKRKNNQAKGRRGKNNAKDIENPKEVIHVRARRGQATDSHSLAERVRREKINEKLRCLQDIVPGCYKAMGMAVMLDEIITYVQSLQNQVEFLSMKLTAASSFYDFNSDVEVTPTMQGTNAYESQEMERLVREGGYGGLSCFHSTWPL